MRPRHKEFGISRTRYVFFLLRFSLSVIIVWLSRTRQCRNHLVLVEVVIWSVRSLMFRGFWPIGKIEDEKKTGQSQKKRFEFEVKSDIFFEKKIIFSPKQLAKGRPFGPATMGPAILDGSPAKGVAPAIERQKNAADAQITKVIEEFSRRKKKLHSPADTVFSNIFTN
jgi:hypothetical protein